MLYLASMFFGRSSAKRLVGPLVRIPTQPHIVFHATMILSLELGAPVIKGLKGQRGSENQ